MGTNSLAMIHAEPGIPWHAARALDMSAGLTALGIEHGITCSRVRISDGPAVLFGTSLWRGIEQAEGDWLLVDRASVGDPDYVSLVWNGHGRRGDHCVPADPDPGRWEALGIELWPQAMDYEHVVICGQTEPYTPSYARIEDWYASIKGATHFRPHPAGSNPTGLPEWRDWYGAMFHVLNSSVGVEALIRGRHVEIHDPGCMAYGVDDREAWAQWLAWTQWSWSEIREGESIEHLFYG
jgi:hypothetical protein